MEISTRVQNALLAVLAVVAISLTTFAVLSVGDAGTPPGEGAGTGAGIAASGAGQTDGAATTGAPQGTADDSAISAQPAASPGGPASVETWRAAWAGEDADLLVIGDGYSNLRSQWVQQWAINLATERPLQVHLWAEAEDVSFNDPDLLSEGSGPALTIWNASRTDTTIADAAEHVERFLGAAAEIDAVLVSVGRGSADEDVAEGLDQLMGELDTDLPVLVLVGPPGLYDTEVSDGILAWAEDHADRVSLIDLRDTAPDQATAEEWAEAFRVALVGS